MGSRKHYVGLPNFAEVSPNLFRGGQPGVDGLEALKKMGVSVVIDMRGTKSSHEQLAVRKLGMEYIAIPWHCPFPFRRDLREIFEGDSRASQEEGLCALPLGRRSHGYGNCGLPDGE